jgi:hypothetical protein
LSTSSVSAGRIWPLKRLPGKAMIAYSTGPNSPFELVRGIVTKLDAG